MWKKIPRTIVCLLLALFAMAGVLAAMPTEAQAASSYTNAELFYNSTGLKDGKHIEGYGGDVYFATRGKTKSSGSTITWRSFGFDVTVSGNGASVSFAIDSDKGTVLTKVPNSSVSSGDGYSYNLFRIAVEDLYRLTAMQSGGSTVFSVRKIKAHKIKILNSGIKIA